MWYMDNIPEIVEIPDEFIGRGYIARYRSQYTPRGSAYTIDVKITQEHRYATGLKLTRLTEGIIQEAIDAYRENLSE